MERTEALMGKMLISVEWDGLGSSGPLDIKEILESHYKSKFSVRRLNVEATQREKLAYSAKEATSLLRISVTMAYSLIYQKQIPAIQYGKRWLIPRVALEKQLGGSTTLNEKTVINNIEKADILATIDESIKLYDLLRGKLTTLVKNMH